MILQESKPLVFMRYCCINLRSTSLTIKNDGEIKQEHIYIALCRIQRRSY